jgi:mono/diheme cytochrome c family protein
MREDLLNGAVLSAVGCMLLAARLSAQSGPAAHRSTQAGVYNAAQATRGKDLYAGMCKSCHTAASHTGVAFRKSWDGRSLSELFGYISTKMPKNEPGSLAPEEYADVLAYLLKLNEMPEGAVELPPDTTVLGAIRIDARPAPLRPVKR